MYPDQLFSEMMEQTTKHGIDKMDLMIKFIPILNPEEGKEQEFLSGLKSFLSEKLKRELTPQEEIALLEGILKYLQSEPATNERRNAMKYLFETNFLNG